MTSLLAATVGKAPRTSRWSKRLIEKGMCDRRASHTASGHKYSPQKIDLEPCPNRSKKGACLTQLAHHFYLHAQTAH